MLAEAGVAYRLFDGEIGGVEALLDGAARRPGVAALVRLLLGRVAAVFAARPGQAKRGNRSPGFGDPLHLDRALESGNHPEIGLKRPPFHGLKHQRRLLTSLPNHEAEPGEK